MYNEEDCPNLKCGDCKFYKNGCKKIDGKHIRYYLKVFTPCDEGASNTICSNFVPMHPEYADIKGKWTNFDDYWKVYSNVWLFAHEKTQGIALHLDDDDDTIYYVPLKVWLYEDLCDADGKLKAYKKAYYKRTREGFGYKLVCEEI